MKKKNILALSVAALLTVSVAALAACGKGGGTDAAELPDSDAGRTTNVSVHDPSIFQDTDGTYYAFGSHFMVASSTDLIHWTQRVGDGSSEENGLKEAQKLYGNGVNWRTVLHDSVAHAGTKMPSTWAPDVNLHNGKYYMYYSLTAAFGSGKSVIGRVSAENVLGPYSNEEVIIKSTADVLSSAAPNCIDPELFEDKNGGLWMVYGSSGAGIHIIELENSGEKWGLPKENSEINKLNNGFGKKIWNGGGPVVEGPFVFYNETTGYYYLMTTYGALASDYNMHVARSSSPDGPYSDVTEADMATLTTSGTRGGNKIAGNYWFGRGAAGNDGFAAMGHNSVVKDADGRYFVIYHSRKFKAASSNEVTAGHNLYVSQLFFNEDGWPVMSPTAYVGESLGKVTKSDLAGEYDLVLHTETTTVVPARAEKYTLGEDGKVTKGTDEVGTWEIVGDYYVTVTLGEVAYKGVATPCWDMYSGKNKQKGVFGITAVSNAGRSLWALGV